MKTRHILLAAAVASCATAAIASDGPSGFAVVNSDGSLARGFNAVSSSRIALGQYEVVFNQKVNLCGYTAAIGLSGSIGTSDFGSVNVASRDGNKNALLVQTFRTANNASDLGFHVILAC
jgi:hypothetical protein